ncbi:NADH dehydrogenase iron-sulfur protein 6 mitochondrial [Fasciolopsis buskii]|uniref:NADH dehydrogenase iron-sulfur protein 6 mitochondrial n=1 Tax=Fasciolopsis buskii TaxID=27845 RepID=A0A8E0RPY2_9TREM|nr:NADH dehydrogenase iron-sulfur protein 6 mitochondrial [Fasciolopsis buski]
MALFLRTISSKCKPLAIVGCRFTSSVDSAVKETHTGQKFDPGDFRAARFTESSKLVNSNFAAKLIADVPPILCKEHIVSCDGGEAALGHPKVYINLVSCCCI